MKVARFSFQFSSHDFQTVKQFLPKHENIRECHLLNEKFRHRFMATALGNLGKCNHFRY